MSVVFATIDRQGVAAAHDLIRPHIRRTPVVEAASADFGLRPSCSLSFKLELFQHGGSFKPRGALCVMLDLAPDALARGVTALSAGNHAIAVAEPARLTTGARSLIHVRRAPAR